MDQKRLLRLKLRLANKAPELAKRLAFLPTDQSSEPSGEVPPQEERVIQALSLFYEALEEKLSQVQRFEELSGSQRRIIHEVVDLLEQGTEILVSGEYDYDDMPIDDDDDFDATQFLADEEDM